MVSSSPIHYYAKGSTQYAAWKQITDLGITEEITTETLSQAAQYEVKVWQEYVTRYGNIGDNQAKKFMYVRDSLPFCQVIIDGWIVLQVAHRIDRSKNPSSSPPTHGSLSGGGIIATNVDYRLAQSQAQQDALSILNQLLEYDVERLLRYSDQYLRLRNK
ncbi:hypothetical protein B0F90DRAFT_1670018 [Multifurca ochricompacta]|uniref:Uncharacterized protein n=1 Tax=Multifurca ochricompacta TaxID=376703 RepID=A0AAD4QJW6_9AGAM|nr:hypothetical protein B0F90DRAFT_1670018 [Multifurca ochricompacta]